MGLAQPFMIAENEFGLAFSLKETEKYEKDIEKDSYFSWHVGSGGSRGVCIFIPPDDEAQQDGRGAYHENGRHGLEQAYAVHSGAQGAYAGKAA